MVCDSGSLSAKVGASSCGARPAARLRTGVGRRCSLEIVVGSGERVSILELYQAMAEAQGSDLEPVMGETRAGDVRHSLADLQRAEELLGYLPAVSWRDGLKKTLEWYKSERGLPS